MQEGPLDRLGGMRYGSLDLNTALKTECQEAGLTVAELNRYCGATTPSVR
jgi:hypothetical protein